MKIMIVAHCFRSLGGISPRSLAIGCNRVLSRQPCVLSCLSAKYHLLQSDSTRSTKLTHTTFSSLLAQNINMSTGNKKENATSQEPLMSDAGVKNSNRLVWVDLEMTGLDVDKERIIEIACLISEGDLTVVAEGPNLIIHQSDELLDNMGEWCTRQHGESGLTDAVKESKISTEEAEKMVIAFLEEHIPKGVCPIAGNSVGTDKLFIQRYMPKLAEYLHYRIVDVSTVKELCRRWYPKKFSTVPPKKVCHRAMSDIYESIEELKYYRSAIFVNEDH